MACLYMFVFPNDAFFMEKSMLGTTPFFSSFFFAMQWSRVYDSFNPSIYTHSSDADG